MNVTQGVFKNTSIYGMTFIDKYSGIKSIITSEGYMSKFLDKANTNTSQTSTILSDDNTYYNIVEDCTLNNCNIETGRFINCIITGNNDMSNYIKNGYFSGCTFYNYVIDDGKFVGCSMDDTNIFNNGFWDNENSDFSWTKPWTSGVWNSGKFDNPYGWYGGTFNGGTFENSYWSGGTANGGTFIGIKWHDGLVRYADFIDECIFENGVFNNGTFTDSSFNGGYFNGGTMKNSNIYGSSVKSVINGGIIFNCNIDGDVDINGGYFENDSNLYSIYNANVYNSNMSNLNVIGGNFYNGNYKNIIFYGGDIFNGFYYNINSSVLKMLSEDGNFLIMEDGSNALFEESANELLFGLTIHNGTFRNSIFEDTNIKNGNFTNCYSKNSLFEYSVYTDGNMLDCVWRDGYWNDGAFITTMINSGSSNSLAINVNATTTSTTTIYSSPTTTTTTTYSGLTTTTTTTMLGTFIINSINYSELFDNSVDIKFSGVPSGSTTIIIYCSSDGINYDFSSAGNVVSPRKFSLNGKPNTTLTFKLTALGGISPVDSNIYLFNNVNTTTTTTSSYNPISSVDLTEKSMYSLYMFIYGGVPPYTYTFSAYPETCGSLSISPGTTNINSNTLSYTAGNYIGAIYHVVASVHDSVNTLHNVYSNELIVTMTCLVPNTLITMFDNSTKLLSDINIGDKLLSISNDAYVESNVTSKSTHLVFSIVNINQGLLESSEGHVHLIKIEDSIIEIDAINLKVGDILINKDKQEVPITSISIVNMEQLVINISTDLGTYIANNILTHNKSICREQIQLI